MTSEEARARVTTGATHLDKVRPGWAHQIDVGRLEMDNPCRCVVGQLGSANWVHGLRVLACPYEFNEKQERNTWAIDHGLLIPSWETLDVVHDRTHYGLLQEAWIEAIADRVVKTEPVPAALVGVGVGV